PTGSIRLRLHTKHQKTAFTRSFAPFSLSANKCCNFFVIPVSPPFLFSEYCGIPLGDFPLSTERCAGSPPTWRHKRPALQAGFHGCPARQFFRRLRRECYPHPVL